MNSRTYAESDCGPKLTIKPVSSDVLHPLYVKYPGQAQPQRAFVYLDLRTGEAGADWDPEIGNSVPADVWHGDVLRWPISPSLTADEINDLLHELEPHIRRLLNRDEDASTSIARICEEAQTSSGGVYQAEDWLRDFTLRDLMRDLQVDHFDDLAEAIELEARYNHGVTVLGVAEYLQRLKEEEG